MELVLCLGVRTISCKHVALIYPYFLSALRICISCVVTESSAVSPMYTQLCDSCELAGSIEPAWLAPVEVCASWSSVMLCGVRAHILLGLGLLVELCCSSTCWCELFSAAPFVRDQLRQLCLLRAISCVILVELCDVTRTRSSIISWRSHSIL